MRFSGSVGGFDLGAEVHRRDSCPALVFVRADNFGSDKGFDRVFSAVRRAHPHVVGCRVENQKFEHGLFSVLSRLVGSFRSEEHTSELQSLMRISYAVFCLKKKKTNRRTQTN